MIWCKNTTRITQMSSSSHPLFRASHILISTRGITDEAELTKKEALLADLQKATWRGGREIL